jgi:hypothetical protein
VCTRGSNPGPVPGPSTSPLEPTGRAPVNPFLIALPVLLACLLAGYLLRERSLRDLDVTQAGTLVLTLRPVRIRFVIAVACLLALFLLLRFTLPRFTSSLFISTLLFLLAAIAISQLAGRRLLIRAHLPPDFIRRYAVAQVVDVVGYASLLATMVATLWMHGHA